MGGGFPQRKEIMKKSQLKEAVKAIVRECVNERCGGSKAKRMFKHIKDSEKKQGKSTKVAKKIAGATVNKRLKNEQVDADMIAGEKQETERGNERNSPELDKIVKFAVNKLPNVKDPAKIARVTSLLFKHQHSNKEPDPEAVTASIKKHMSNKDARGTNECGLTSEDEGGEHGYDEREEIMLIKVMELIAKKLSAMHSGNTLVKKQDAEEPSSLPFGDEEPQDEEPLEEPQDEEPLEEPEEPEVDNDDEPPIKEVSTKTQTSAYKVAPNPSTLTQRTDDEKLKPKDPRLTETSLIKASKKAVSYKTQGAAYKISPNPSCRVNSDNKDRREPGDPELTEDKEYDSGANSSCPRCNTVLVNKNGKLRCDNPDCMHNRRGHSFRSSKKVKENRQFKPIRMS